MEPILLQLSPSRQPEYPKSPELALITNASNAAIPIKESILPEYQPPGHSTLLFTIIPVDPNIQNECSTGNEHTR